MDFAPYQDTNPEQERAKSPPPRHASRSPQPPQQTTSRNIASPLHSPTRQPKQKQKQTQPTSSFGFGGGSARGRGGYDPVAHRDDEDEGGYGGYQNNGGGADDGWDEDDLEADVEAGGRGFSGRDVVEGARQNVDLFETSLPLRMDHEAMLAYLALPPAGGVALLVLEHQSDYVRFHAWQSSLLFSAIFVVHLIFSFTAIISWLLFVGDIVIIAFLTWRAYLDADTLDRFEVPFFGRLASQFVDDE